MVVAAWFEKLRASAVKSKERSHILKKKHLLKIWDEWCASVCVCGRDWIYMVEKYDESVYDGS